MKNNLFLTSHSGDKEPRAFLVRMWVCKMHICPLVAVEDKLKKLKLSRGRRDYKIVVSSFLVPPLRSFTAVLLKLGIKQKWSHLSYYKDELVYPTCKISIQVR